MKIWNGFYSFLFTLSSPKIHFLRSQNFFSLQASITIQQKVQCVSTWVSLESLLNTLLRKCWQKFPLLVLFCRQCCCKVGWYFDLPSEWSSVQQVQQVTQCKRVTFSVKTKQLTFLLKLFEE